MMIMRKVVRPIITPPPDWSDFEEQQSPFIHMYLSRQQK